ncbi:flagellar export chaperone FliS [Bacillus thuringiensis]|uniref:flagellar export chaperone FliS n=1 Tax=Bacillus thuringiensis TaxID=1428 RepID=UPI0021D6501D|nr:flagellar export chaperone FliS [Bacillus thuringiensis]MCU7667004.1 flagellar protein FliS [Bacillus thuringiensis]
MEGYKKYMEDEIMTNHPVENTILMYENCIKRLRVVKKYYQDFKFSQADEELERVEQILAELKMQVDESVDLELAKDLYGLYDYILAELFKIHKLRIIEPIANVEGILKDLIEGFRGAMKNAE